MIVSSDGLLLNILPLSIVHEEAIKRYWKE
jgi:hypothetical protein